jgi:TRAP-type C4-dicarboxylate transport system substrate-binding protein
MKVARLALLCAAGAWVAAAPATGRGEPTHLLRLGTIAPDGSEWARLEKSLAREVEHETDGEVAIKWYFGGIAGGETDMIERIRRGQLDGAASGGMMCQRLAPSMRVMRIAGLFQSRDEALHVLARLRPRLDKEFAKSGFVNLGEAGIGSDIIFSRTPVRAFDDLKKTRLWVWDLDDVWLRELPLMGINTVAAPPEQAGAAYDEQRSDGFLGITTAALAFQWSTRAKYYSDLRVGYMMGCVVVAQSAFDPLPTRAQQIVRAAAAKFMMRMESTGQQQETALLGGLFERQGLKRVAVSDAFRSAFFLEARAARDKLGSSLVPTALLNEVNAWLADYRAEHSR